jgi:hypothetical protein
MMKCFKCGSIKFKPRYHTNKYTGEKSRTVYKCSTCGEEYGEGANDMGYFNEHNILDLIEDRKKKSTKSKSKSKRKCRCK